MTLTDEEKRTLVARYPETASRFLVRYGRMRISVETAHLFCDQLTARVLSAVAYFPGIVINTRVIGHVVYGPPVPPRMLKWDTAAPADFDYDAGGSIVQDVLDRLRDAIVPIAGAFVADAAVAVVRGARHVTRTVDRVGNAVQTHSQSVGVTLSHAVDEVNQVMERTAEHVSKVCDVQVVKSKVDGIVDVAQTRAQELGVTLTHSLSGACSGMQSVAGRAVGAIVRAGLSDIAADVGGFRGAAVSSEDRHVDSSFRAMDDRRGACDEPRDAVGHSHCSDASDDPFRAFDPGEFRNDLSCYDKFAMLDTCRSVDRVSGYRDLAADMIFVSNELNGYEKSVLLGIPWSRLAPLLVDWYYRGRTTRIDVCDLPVGYAWLSLFPYLKWYDYMYAQSGDIDPGLLECLLTTVSHPAVYGDGRLLSQGAIVRRFVGLPGEWDRRRRDVTCRFFSTLRGFTWLNQRFRVRRLRSIVAAWHCVINESPGFFHDLEVAFGERVVCDAVEFYRNRHDLAMARKADMVDRDVFCKIKIL